MRLHFCSQNSNSFALLSTPLPFFLQVGSWDVTYWGRSATLIEKTAFKGFVFVCSSICDSNQVKVRTGDAGVLSVCLWEWGVEREREKRQHEKKRAI